MQFTESRTSLDEEYLLPSSEKTHKLGFYGYNDEKRSGRLLPFSVALNAILLAVAAFAALLQLRHAHQTCIPNEIYSPAQSAVEYKTVVFTGGLKVYKSEYQGSSDEVNTRWEALYNDVGLSQIPAESAAKLPNETTPLANDPTHFMVELDVFHQLHCLNLLRELVYPGFYQMDLTSGSEEAEDNTYHMEHCYEQLRQSLQCASDIGTIYWEWSPEKQKMFGNLKPTHTCRNFEKIRQWAVEHRLKEEFDWFVPVEGAPIRQN